MDLPIVAEQLQIRRALVEHEAFERAARCADELRPGRRRGVARPKRSEESNERGRQRGECWKCGPSGSGKSAVDDIRELLIGACGRAHGVVGLELGAVAAGTVARGATCAV